MIYEQKDFPLIWKMPNLLWGMVAAVAIMLAVVFFDALALMVKKWSVSEPD
jgi:hypothetical protein